MSETFHFLRPLWFFMLLPLSFWLFWLWRMRVANNAWQQACDAHLLPHLLMQFGGSRQRLVLWLLALGWLLAVLALAGPTGSKRPLPVFKTEQARVLILDLSRSMDATDIKPSRLTQAKFKLLDILKHSREGQTALLAFAGDVYVVSPLTHDASTIASLVPALDTHIMPVLGSKPLLALQAARDLLKQGGAMQGHIILITDGVEDSAAQVFAEKLAQQGYRLSVLGVGSAQGAPIPELDGGFLKDSKGAIVLPRLDAQALQQLAQAGGGLYVPYTADQRDLHYLLTPPAHAEFKQTQDNQISESWEDQGAWLLWLLIPLTALSFRRGWLLAVLPLLLLMPPDADAGWWDDLWLRQDQQAQQALIASQAEQAAQLFNSSDWRGVAQYRAHDFAAAAESFAQLDSDDGHYNRGNALAKMGDLHSAVQAYEEALKKNPQHSQARDNKALIEQLLEQQAQDSQSGEGEQGEDKQDKGEQSPADSNADSNAEDSQQASAGQPSQQNESQQGDGQNQPQQAQESGDQQGQQGQSAADEATQQTPSAQAQQAQQGEQASDEQIRQALQQQSEQNAQEQGQEAALSEAEQSEAEAQAQPMPLSSEELQAQEKEIALEQWLNRVPDDPSGLWRRKFALEYQKRQLERQKRGVPETRETEKTW